jgi:hypothetical protein
MALKDLLTYVDQTEGAFGHPKLWEKLLGGVTRDLLTGMSLPLLMSH